MKQDYSGVRAKRIPTEFALIKRREDLKEYKMQEYTDRLGLVLNVSI